MREPPDGYRDSGDTVLSNLDHSIDRSLEQRLRQEKVVMQFSARNFCGDVWWNGQFHCLVRVRGSARETVIRPTLEEIMDVVCDTYGSE
jgi:hypothetical protein